MDALTDVELAEQAGTTLARVRLLADLGIVAAEADGSFLPPNIQRVRFAEAVERSGIELDAVGAAIASKQLSLSFLDLLFSDPAGYSGRTYGEVSAEYGYTIEFIQRIHEAVGLPTPQPDQRVREEDLQMFSMGQFALGLGMSEAHVARVLRVYGENLGRIAQAEAPFFHTYVEEPLLRSGMSEAQMLEIGSQMSPQTRTMVTQLILWLYRRHQEHSIIEHVVEHLEAALEQLGLAASRPARPAGMAFLDLVGYTRLTEEQGDEAAAELVSRLAGVVQTESARYGGRPVKWLGDGVMFHFPDPAQAVRCSLELVDRTPALGLPPAHVGVNAGPVIFRDGDYFGRTVNVASRIAAKAGSSEVLVGHDVVELAEGLHDVRFEPIGPVELKGLSKPLPLHRATRI